MGWSIGERLIQALQKQTNRVIYFLEAENISLNIVVHEVRKSFKRIRALLHFCQNSEDGYAFVVAQQVAEFGRSISALRNSWVNMLVLDRISQINPHIPERKMKMVKERFGEKNRLFLNEEFSNKKLAISMRQYFEKLEVDFQTNLGTIEKQNVQEQLNLYFYKGYELYQDEEIFRDSGKTHELRKRLKTLYYQTSFLKVMHAKFFKPKSDQLDIITEQLGEDHDLCVFLDEIKQAEYGLEPAEIEIVENKINHLRELNRLKCKPRLKQLFSESPESFSEKITAILEV